MIETLSTRLAAQWKRRLLRLESRLRSDPRDFKAPLWRIQARVLRFVLARYGDDPTIDRPRLRLTMKTLLSFPVSPSSRRKRSPERTRFLLERIAAANPQ